MQVFEVFLKTLTGSENRSDRQAFSRLLPDVRTIFYHGFNEIVDHYGADRRVIEADLAVLACLRLLWELVPSPLFASNDVDYEGLAHRTWSQTIKATPSEDVTRGLSVVYRRLRQYYRKGFRKTSLDLDRVAHRRLFDEQQERCAVCRYHFQVNQQAILDESSFEFVEDYAPRTQEVTLEAYHRRPELDHIIPFFLGGDGAENWQILCRTCNAGKGTALSWLTRRGWVPPLSPSDAMKLSPSLRYVCIAKEATHADALADGTATWRLFKKNENGLVTLPNLQARLC